VGALVQERHHRLDGAAMLLLEALALLVEDGAEVRLIEALHADVEDHGPAGEADLGELVDAGRHGAYVDLDGHEVVGLGRLLGRRLAALQEGVPAGRVEEAVAHEAERVEGPAAGEQVEAVALLVAGRAEQALAGAREELAELAAGALALAVVEA